MKLCYIDESGIGKDEKQPFAVMTGVIVDHYRMRPTKDAWGQMLSDIGTTIGRKIDELHTRELYSGNSWFRKLNGEQRQNVIDQIFQLLEKRGHSIIFVAVDGARFKAKLKEEEKIKVLSPWGFMALHIALGLQKEYQKLSRNKGNFLLMFDNKRGVRKFVKLLLNAPDWTDTYYKKERRQKKIDQLIDVPHFVDSKQVMLIQIADFISYFLRRRMELCEGAQDEDYEGETGTIASCFRRIRDLSLKTSVTYPERGRCECADLFYDCAPDCIKGNRF